jgi:hypothetical protein
MYYSRTERNRRVGMFLRPLLLSLLVNAAGASAAPHSPNRRYGLEERRVDEHHVRVRVFERKTGRTVWRYDAGQEVKDYQWSPDSKSLALVDDRFGLWKHDWCYRLVLWRPGRRDRVLDDLRPLKRFEVLNDMGWSPDGGKLFLLGSLSQGEGDAGLNDLWCFDLHTQRSSLLTRRKVISAEWRGSTQIRAQVWTGKWRDVPNWGRSMVERTVVLNGRRTYAPPRRSNYPPGR